VAGDKGPGRIFFGRRAVEDRIDIDEARGSRKAAGATVLRCRLLHEGIALDLETASAGRGYRAELGLNPVGCSVNALPGGKIGIHAGECAARAETDELGDVGADSVRRDSPKGCCDGWIGGGWGQAIGGGSRRLPGDGQGEADRGGSKCNKALHSSISELAASNRGTNCRRSMLTSQRRTVRTREAARGAF